MEKKNTSNRIKYYLYVGGIFKKSQLKSLFNLKNEIEIKKAGAIFLLEIERHRAKPFINGDFVLIKHYSKILTICKIKKNKIKNNNTKLIEEIFRVFKIDNIKTNFTK